MVSQKDSIHPADSHWFQRLAPWSTWGFLEGRRQALGPCSPSCSLKPWWLTVNVHGRNLWRDPRDCNLPKKPEVNVFVGMKWAAQCARGGGPRVLRRERSLARRRRAVPSCPVRPSCASHTVTVPWVCREKAYSGMWWLLLFCFSENFFLP